MCMDTAMLWQFSEHVRGCDRGAMKAGHRALDQGLKAESQEMERRWPFARRAHIYGEQPAQFAAPRISGGTGTPIWATATRSAEEEGERMRWLAALVDESDDAIISKDTEGIIASWNKGAERLFGYPAREVISKSIMILIPPDLQADEDRILERLRNGERIANFETVRLRKDGSLVPVSLTISPIRTLDGKIVGASKIARDISERKQYEEQIVFLAGEAEHRARNILGNVQAIVHLSTSDTAEGLKAAIEGRIQALATVHSLVVQS